MALQALEIGKIHLIPPPPFSCEKLRGEGGRNFSCLKLKKENHPQNWLSKWKQTEYNPWISKQNYLFLTRYYSFFTKQGRKKSVLQNIFFYEIVLSNLQPILIFFKRTLQLYVEDLNYISRINITYSILFNYKL